MPSDADPSVLEYGSVVERGDVVPDAMARRLVHDLRRRVTGTDVPPFDVRFPDGTTSPIATDGTSPQPARFTIRVLSAWGAKALASLDELRVCEAYLRGELDVEGDFSSCLDLRPVFSDRHPVMALARFAWPFLLGQVRSDRTWIPRHYDFGDDFYFAFLDESVRLYSQALYTSEDETLEQAGTKQARLHQCDLPTAFRFSGPRRRRRMGRVRTARCG